MVTNGQCKISDSYLIINITYSGKAKTKLVGLNEKKEREDFAFGMWSNKNDDVDKVVRELRIGISK